MILKEDKQPERERIRLTVQDAREAIYGDHGDFAVIEDKITHTSRWSEHHLSTIMRISDGKFFQTMYSRGLTESQDERPFDYSEPVFNEVFPIIKTITVYE